MSTERILRVRNIRNNPTKFTGETPYSLNKNLGLKGGSNGYYYTAFTNASGPVPDGFDLNKYNALTSNPLATVAELQTALLEVANIEAQYAMAASNTFTSATARPYLPTIRLVKKELTQALSNAQNRVSTSGAPTGNAHVPGSGPTDNAQQNKWSTTKIVLTTVGSAAALGGIFLLIKWIKNK